MSRIRRVVRFVAGVALGGGALAAYLLYVGVDAVLGRLVAVPAAVVAAVVVLVVAEGVVDGLGVWASVRPLRGGLSPGQSVTFALAGDFFDTLSPAGPVSSEPIMAQFIGATTGTGYADALAVRSVAKYVKSAAQLGLSAAVGGLAFLGGPSATAVLVTLGGAVAALALAGVAVVRFRGTLSTAAVTALTPVVRLVSGVYRQRPHDRETVAAAVGRFRSRVALFRRRPGLVALVAVGGVLEQALTAAALWTALSGTGTAVPFLPLLVVVPLPQAASVVPVPASLGAYDLLLAGALSLVTAAPPDVAAAAVVLVRTVTIPFGLAAGGLSVAFLRGWRP